jgi:HD-like signal output (HDOD) protein
VFAPALRNVVERLAAQTTGFLALESEIVGATHQEMGAALTAKWKFPRHVQAAVGFHHRPETLSSELSRFVMIVHCADVLCCQQQIGFSLTAQNEEFTEELLEAIGISIDQLVTVRDEMGPELEEAETLLGGTG